MKAISIVIIIIQYGYRVLTRSKCVTINERSQINTIALPLSALSWLDTKYFAIIHLHQFCDHIGYSARHLSSNNVSAWRWFQSPSTLTRYGRCCFEVISQDMGSNSIRTTMSKTSVQALDTPIIDLTSIKTEQRAAFNLSIQLVKLLWGFGVFWFCTSEQ